jgi:hypothetical protein
VAGSLLGKRASEWGTEADAGPASRGDVANGRDSKHKECTKAAGEASDS